MRSARIGARKGCIESTVLTLSALIVLACAAPRTAQASGANLETFVMAINGESNYSTYGQPDPVNNNFGGWGVGIPGNAVGDPTVLASDGIDGTFRVQDSSSATVLTDSLSSSGSRSGLWSYSGSTSTAAQSGQLKSESHAIHRGIGYNYIINSAESYSMMRDTFTPTSSLVANGTRGTMTLGVTFDGSMTVTGTGTVGMLLRYNYGPNPILNPGAYLLESFAHIAGNGYQIYGPHSSYGPSTTPPGMAYDIGPIQSSGQPTFITFGGSTKVYATVPVTYGVNTDFQMGLMTWTGIGNGDGNMDSLWAHTATISSIQMLDSGGAPVSSFSIASGSGTLYDANGAHLASATPEPGPFALLFTGTLSLWGMIARRRR